jgi:arabinogalactan endo-1,4-beta-galactosidase
MWPYAKPCWLLLVLVSGCNLTEAPDPPPVVEPTPDRSSIRAADLSFLPMLEAEPTVFYTADGQPQDVLTLLQEAGCNTIRLRLWHTPASPHASLAEVAALARRIRERGLGLWLALHYSDTWADPGRQETPAAWENLSETTLRDSVFAYTTRVLATLQPDIVQIGNEINGGLLWETGRLARTEAFIALLKEGIRAARTHDPDLLVLLHVAGLDQAPFFFNLMKTHQVDYDLAGLSYYPIWHGTDLDHLETTLRTVAQTSGKDVLLAETAYPFTLEWADFTHNIVGLPSHLVAPYDASPEGQRDFLLELRRRLAQVPGGRGFCYWGGEWVAFRGPQAPNGSAWENQALFDFEHRALPALDAFAP